MTKEIDKSLGDEKTRNGKERAGGGEDTAKSLGDSQTLLGGLAASSEEVNDGLELTDLSARYTIVKTLGQGGMGEVLLATDNRLKRQVAIKRIRGEQSRSRAAVQRFLTEAQAIAALNHPNIVQVYDYGRDREGPFLIMEYVDGQSLLDRCKDNPLPVDEAVELTCELLGGLGRAHELGIIHRDIKPANILRTKDGCPKLTDFGLAKQTAADHGQTVAGAVLGTIDFMPPEQRRDSTLVDARSDLWSLAATLYQMLTGKSPKIIRFDLLPLQLVGIMGRALDELPAQRFQSTAEFREALRAWQVGERAGHEFAQGQCPECGTRNSENVKFCKECSKPLKVPCLGCGVEIPVWDKGCTECGLRQAEQLEIRRSELLHLQSEVIRLRELGKLNEAIKLLDSADELRHPQLQDYRKWLDRARPEFIAQASWLGESASRALSEAQTHLAVWDYRAAIRVLESLPADAIGEEHRRLLTALIADWTEAQEKTQQIQQRIKLRQLDGLLPLVRRVVELRGDREDLKKLLMQLEQREAKRAALATSQQVAPTGEAFELVTGAVKASVASGKQKARKNSKRRSWPLLATLGLGLSLLIGAWMLIRGVEGSAPTVAVNRPAVENQPQVSNSKRPSVEPESRKISESSTKPSVVQAPEVVAEPARETRPPTSANQSNLPELAGQRNVQADPSAMEANETPPSANAPSNSAESPSSVAPKPSEQANESPRSDTQGLPPSPELDSSPQEITNSIGIKMMLIPAGTFDMGEGSETFEVALSKSHYLGIYEVTQEEYKRVMGDNPSNFKGERNPVDQVTWDEAVEFCRKLSDLPEEKLAGRVYRLPTEAEWEYACRAQSKAMYHFGDKETELGDFAWYDKNSRNRSHPVGEKKPNAWGLYDMHGNVWEWCADWHGEYPDESVTDPLGPDEGTYRMIRGGGWGLEAGDCRAAIRYWRDPSTRSSYVGFRVALSLSNPSQ